MIFVTLGSQKFQFNRLLAWIDEAINDSVIHEAVVAQVGYSDYRSQNFKCKSFFKREEYLESMDDADIILTHAGTGAIVSALKKNKPVIAIPRLSEFGEHVDDHQVQIVENFKNQNLILCANSREELFNCLNKIKGYEFNNFESDNKSYIELLTNFISGVEE